MRVDISGVPFTFTAQEEDILRTTCDQITHYLRKKPVGYRVMVCQHVRALNVVISGAVNRSHRS